jgi:glycosyltransferase involved in cell wall biosynthesis
MACGTPVIAFERGSMAELVDEGVTGRLVTDVDGAAAAVAAVATIGDLDRAAIRAAAVERFGVDRMVDEYVEVYERLVR